MVKTSNKNNRVSFSMVITYIILLVWVSITIVTVGWVIMTSFKSNQELFANIWKLPEKLHFENYVRAWTHGNMQVYFFNTVLYLIITLAVLTVFGSMASYVLVRYKKFRWVGWIFILIIAGMSIPGQLAVIPLYITYARVGLLNTYVGMILLYCAVFMPFTVFVLSGFFRTVPFEIEEAAQIDGASKFRTFAEIVMPMVKPGLVTVIIFNFLSIWNEYFYAMVLITDEKKMPLSAGLYNLKSQQQMGLDWVGLFAGVVILLVPTMIMFFIMQDKIAKGVTAGAIKG